MKRQLLLYVNTDERTAERTTAADCRLEWHSLVPRQRATLRQGRPCQDQGPQSKVFTQGNEHHQDSLLMDMVAKHEAAEAAVGCGPQQAVRPAEQHSNQVRSASGPGQPSGQMSSCIIRLQCTASKLCSPRGWQARQHTCITGCCVPAMMRGTASLPAKALGMHNTTHKSMTLSKACQGLHAHLGQRQVWTRQGSMAAADRPRAAAGETWGRTANSLTPTRPPAAGRVQHGAEGTLGLRLQAAVPLVCL